MRGGDPAASQLVNRRKQGTVSGWREGEKKCNPNLRGDEDADERARLEVPHFEVAVLAAGVDGLAVHDDGEHRARAALEGVQQHRRRVRGCELPELWEIAFRVSKAKAKIAQPQGRSHSQSARAG